MIELIIDTNAGDYHYLVENVYNIPEDAMSEDYCPYMVIQVDDEEHYIKKSAINRVVKREFNDKCTNKIDAKTPPKVAKCKKEKKNNKKTKMEK